MVASTLWRGKNPAKLARHGDFRGSWERRTALDGECDFVSLSATRWCGRLRQAGANWAHRGWSRGSTSLGLVDAFKESEKLRVFGHRGPRLSSRLVKPFARTCSDRRTFRLRISRFFEIPTMRCVAIYKGKYPGENDRCPVVVKADGLA